MLVLLARQVGDVVHHLVLRYLVVDPLAVGRREELLDAGRLLQHLVLVPARVARGLEESWAAVLGHVRVGVVDQLLDHVHVVEGAVRVQPLTELFRGRDGAGGGRGRAGRYAVVARRLQLL